MKESLKVLRALLINCLIVVNMPPKYSQHYRSEWEQMLDFKDWLQPVKDDTTKAYLEETLKAVKPSLIDIAQEFRVDAATMDRLMSQWRNIVHIKWESTSSTVEFWNEVIDYKDAAGNNPFADLSQLAISLLSLPHSNAEIERVFSQMNIVKTKLRNRLSIKTLNAILYVRFGLKRAGKCCYSYTVPDNVLRSIGTKESYSLENKASTSTCTSAAELADEDEDINILFSNIVD
ncbi:uncharacterized protein LOC124635914 [Helicoverpa zea]|uniref:uncharacterized protein LOC124635914 n=1 Tax=Helicoverpa zea TaxID=7113 RepID=UPI001F55DB59|nr:uncharacterized protein LOC124635914 [Helicoverpa zea]